MGNFLSLTIFMNTLKLENWGSKNFSSNRPTYIKEYGKISPRRKSQKQQESKTTYEENFE